MARKYQFTVTLTVRECANGSLGPLPFLIQTSALKKAITDNINYQCMCKGTLFLHYLPFGSCHFASDWLMYASFTLLRRNLLLSLSHAMLRRAHDTGGFSSSSLNHRPRQVKKGWEGFPILGLTSLRKNLVSHKNVPVNSNDEAKQSLMLC